MRFTNLLLITSAFMVASVAALQNDKVNSTSDREGKALTYGHVFNIDSKHLQTERRYMVSLPERYYGEGFNYPTLYIIDADFQFHHVANTVKNLARMGKISQMIVVGIANEGPRDYLLANTWKIDDSKEFGHIDSFNQFLKDELIPEISTNYRTNDKRAIVGYSLGGLFVMSSYIDQNSPFNAFIAMSPSTWFDDYDYSDKLKQQIESSKKLISQKSSIVSSGKLVSSKAPVNQNAPLFVSLANEKGMGVKDVVKQLKEYEVKNWVFKEYPEETHFSTALPALIDALVFLSPNHYLDFDDLDKIDDVDGIFKVFELNKLNWGGFRLDWLQCYTLAKFMIGTKRIDKMPLALSKTKALFSESVSELSLNFALGLNRKEKYQEAIKLLTKVSTDNQNNAKWHFQMSLAMEGVGNIALAIEHQKRALVLAQTNQLESWEYWEFEPYRLPLLGIKN